jgi:hypothetical protein
MGLVQQAIEDRVSDGRLADPAVPVFDRQLGGDDRGAAIGAIVDDFKQVFTAERIEGVQSPVVEGEDVELGERDETALVRAVAAGDAQFLEQARHAGVERGPAEAAGALRECAGEPGLAGAGGPGDEDALRPLEPLAVGEAGEQPVIEAAARALVEVLEVGLACLSRALRSSAVRRRPLR